MRAPLFALALTGAACGSAFAEQASEPAPLKLNQIQVLGTHNSYSLGVDPQLASLLDPLVGGGISAMLGNLSEERRRDFLEYHPNFDKLSFSEGLNYGYPEGLAAQLDAGLRSLEIDVFRDPEGGRFKDPAGYRLLGGRGVDPATLAPHDATDLDKPGFKVLHIADVDFRSTCNLLTRCLHEMRAWSDANPGHTPVFVLLETKDAGFPGLPGAAEVLPFDVPAYDALDAEIISVIGRDKLITPDDVRGDFATLEDAVLARNWPTLADSRGKFVFLMLTALNVEGLSGYFEGRPNLEGRVAFLRSEPGQSHAAFLLLDNAIIRANEIPARVRQGYLVRTRSDIETYEAKVNDSTRADAAFESGAQIVSTDFYKPGNAYGTDYVVSLPGGGDMRCNPVNADCN
jgi:hypothetical protein